MDFDAVLDDGIISIENIKQQLLHHMNFETAALYDAKIKGTLSFSTSTPDSQIYM